MTKKTSNHNTKFISATTQPFFFKKGNGTPFIHTLQKLSQSNTTLPAIQGYYKLNILFSKQTKKGGKRRRSAEMSRS